jgi:transcription initiation factor TFIIF subunit beta
MENIGDDEKKPFDAEAGGMDDEQFPDPEEVLHIGQPGRNWIVKVRHYRPSHPSTTRLTLHQVQIPKYMMERWSQIKEASQPLGKIRHYADPTQRTHGRFFLVVPRDPPVVAPPGVTLPEEETCDCFELDFVSHDVPNQYVVAQRPKPNVDPRTRARDTALHGKVVYEMNARPFFNDTYQARVRARNEAANTPARQIRMLEESVAGGQGMINRMASGVANDRGFSDLIVRSLSSLPILS